MVQFFVRTPLPPPEWKSNKKTKFEIELYLGIWAIYAINELDYSKEPNYGYRGEEGIHRGIHTQIQ